MGKSHLLNGQSALVPCVPECRPVLSQLSVCFPVLYESEQGLPLEACGVLQNS